jgi:CBS domain-containing protein/uncharacterized membrane protein YuzA (DUF378 family)
MPQAEVDDRSSRMKGAVMRHVDRAMRVLLIIGGLNWLAVAVAKFDLVAALAGRRFGKPNVATRVAYGIVGGAGIYTLSRWIQQTASAGRNGERAPVRVRDVMTTEPRAVEASATVAEAAQLLKREDVGSLPVIGDGALIGMVTDRDIVVRVLAEGRDPQTTAVGEIASRDVAAAAPDQDLDEALRLMARRQIRRLPVVEGDRLVGILAQADMAEAADHERTGEVVEEISR